MPLLPVSHQRQRQVSDCLAACAAMVLDYLRVPYQYEELLRLLQIGDYGTAFSNIRQLVKLGLHAEVRTGDMADIRIHLRNGFPVIAFLNTGMLSYWTTETGHAVVVIGLDEQAVHVHDPYLTNPAKAVPLVEFEAAWIEQDQRYAVIRPR